MARLFRHQPGSPEGKYLVKRRDGTVPQWPHFTLAAADPAAPVALLAYAAECQKNGLDPAYVSDLICLADEFERWRLNNSTGDPDAPRHRKDDQATIEEMKKGFGA